MIKVTEFIAKDLQNNDVEYLQVLQIDESGNRHRTTIPKQYATQEMLDALQAQGEAE